MVSVKCLGKEVLFQNKRDTCFIIMGGKVNYKCKSRVFYEIQKVEDSFKYTEMELGSMVLASHVLSLPLSVKKLKPKKKLDQTSPVKLHEELTPSFSKEKVKVSENFQKSVSLLWTACYSTWERLGWQPMGGQALWLEIFYIKFQLKNLKLSNGKKQKVLLSFA